MRASLIVTAACLLALLAPSCAKKGKSPTTGPLTARERQDRALKDPFGYKPDWQGTGVSGGDTGVLDEEGLRKDLENVFIR